MSHDIFPDDPEDPRNKEEGDEMFSRREKYDRSSAGRGGVSDFVKRAIENTIPKDTFNNLLQQGDRGKKEVLRVIGREVSDFLSHVNLSSEVIKILTALQVDVNASVRFRSNEKQGLDAEIDDASQFSVKVDQASSDDVPTRDVRTPKVDESGTGDF